MTAQEKAKVYELKFDTTRDAILAVEMIISHLILDDKRDIELIKYWDEVIKHLSEKIENC